MAPDAELGGCGRVYANHGNEPLLALLPCECSRLLDVGCGAGGNAALIRARLPECEITGVTHSPAEAELASGHMKQCLVANIEKLLPPELLAEQFDVLIFSHVLEHLREPADVLSRFVCLLKNGGVVLIAAPNVVVWRQRIKFLLGSFEYEPAGLMDETHLRFVTYRTAASYLLARSPDLETVSIGVSGGAPLWWLRRHVLPKSWSAFIDEQACRLWPNLFGGQILIKAQKKETHESGQKDFRLSSDL